MLNPNANGIKPRIAAVAVSNTGVILVRAASTTASCRFWPCSISISVNSTSKIPLRTTTPASAMIPIPVITMQKVISKRLRPRNTPMMLKNISVKMISVLPIELNCIIRIINIKPKDISNAVPKKVDASAWSSWPPPMWMETPSGALKLLMAC